MKPINFCKFHGFGNDYIVIEKESVPAGLPLSELAAAICHRHAGAGADGIAVIEKLQTGEADFFCEILNPDGSIAAFSGNGTRCAVGYLYYKKLWNAKRLNLKVRSGVKKYELLEVIAEGHYRFTAEIGKPRFASDEIPVTTDKPQNPIIDHKLLLGDIPYAVSCVNVGNPVASIFVDDFVFDWRVAGKELEVHQAFPERANIVFVKIIDRQNIELRIWERGAGETSASGTCAGGAAVLSALTGQTGRKVSVHSSGGTTEIEWRSDDEILITGRADLVYCGEWPV